VLTVLMVARDAAATLPEVLAAHRRLLEPPGGWRLVAVDNGSADSTPDLLREAARDLPMEVLSAPEPGQSRARNAAAPSVRGEWVVLTDADAVPREDWLVRLAEAARQHPDHDVLVGTVVPRFETPPPPWVLAAVRHGPMFVRVERPEAGEVHPTEGVGPNVAIRVRALPPPPWCDEALGPDGTSDYPMGGETELLRRLAGRGARAWYAKDAVVEHLVPASRAAPDELLRRAFRHGRGLERLGLSASHGDRLRCGGVSLRTWGDLFGRRVALGRARKRGDATRAFRAAWKTAVLAGQACEARAARGLPDRGPVLRHLPASVRDAIVAAPRYGSRQTRCQPASVSTGAETSPPASLPIASTSGPP
jgi:GT2 family glycosyltransferase